MGMRDAERRYAEVRPEAVKLPVAVALPVAA